MATPKRIVLVGSGIRKEALASVAITPGMVCQRDSNGKFKPHATAGGTAQKLIAIEDDNQGKTIDDVYAIASRVQAEVLQPGAVFYGLLKDGESVAIGDYVESAGTGYVQKYTADSEGIGGDSSGGVVSIPTANVIAQCLEAVDLSDSSGADPATQRIRLEAL